MDIKKRILELSELKDGWLDGEGYHIREEGITWALCFLDKLTIPPPCLYPTPEGGIQAEWSKSEWEIEMNFDFHSKHAHFWALNMETNEEIEESHFIDKEDFINRLQKFYLSCQITRIFKAYDIRGLAPRGGIDGNTAYSIGAAFANLIKKSPVAVGRDMRESGVFLGEKLILGLRDAGVDVVDIGMCSTPMLNCFVAKNSLAGGIMITASHNPAQYNGFKLCREEGIPISSATGINDIKTWVNENIPVPAQIMGTLSNQDFCEPYREFFASKIKPGPRKLKIVVDCGNGMAGPNEFKILEEIFPCIGMFLEPDGSFPNHEANPLVEKNLDDLRHKVREEKADIGIAFDGDVDRAAFVDENGHTVQGDLITALLASVMLKENPGKAVLYDLRSSWAVKEEIAKAGGIPVISRVGHSFIKKTLREHEGILGGELSGHFYFKDMYYLDCGLYAVLKILELLSNSSQTFSEIIKPLDRYPRTGELNFIVDNADTTIEKVKKSLKDNGTVTELDGLSIEFEDWWFNLRKSNTEPLLRLNLQAKIQDVMEEKLSEVKILIGGKPH